MGGVVSSVTDFITGGQVSNANAATAANNAAVGEARDAVRQGLSDLKKNYINSVQKQSI